MNTVTGTEHTMMNCNEQVSVLQILQDVLDIVDEQVDLFDFENAVWNGGGYNMFCPPQDSRFPMIQPQQFDECQTEATTRTGTTSINAAIDQQFPQRRQQDATNTTTLVGAIGAMVSKNYYPTDKPL